MTQIRTWLDFALQQFAAESYLHRFLSGELQLDQVLQLGNNNQPGALPNASLLPGNTRMADQQITEFTQRYQIVNHHANDASGFSATLLFDTATNSYTLSFRSTEYKNQNEGGDYERDGANFPSFTGADGEILTNGFAFGQLAAMEQYYADLKASGTLPVGATLNVTGYSLGGHLATVFTELHATEIQHTYTFNGPGRGIVTGISGQSDPPNPLDAAPIQAMLTRLTEVLRNPEAAPAPVEGDPFADIFTQAKALHDADPSWNPFGAGSAANLYQDPRYVWARHAMGLDYATSAVSQTEVQGGAFDLITQLVGHATHGDQELVANSGIHAVPTTVFIEDQPNLDGFGGFFGLNGDFGTTHSITLIVDSLALMEAFQTVDPNVTQTSLGQIFSAASNQIGSGFVGTFFSLAPLEGEGGGEGGVRGSACLLQVAA